MSWQERKFPSSRCHSSQPLKTQGTQKRTEVLHKNKRTDSKLVFRILVDIFARMLRFWRRAVSLWWSDFLDTIFVLVHQEHVQGVDIAIVRLDYHVFSLVVSFPKEKIANSAGCVKKTRHWWLVAGGWGLFCFQLCTVQQQQKQKRFGPAGPKPFSHRIARGQNPSLLGGEN